MTQLNLNISVSYLLFNIQYPSQVRQVEITTRSRISHFQSIWIKKHRTSKFWSFNSIYMLLFQFVTFIRGSKMSVKAAQFSLLSSAVLLGLWSTRIDLSDLLYMTSNRSVCWTTEKRREINEKCVISFVLNELTMNNICYTYYCVHQAIFIGNIGSVP